MVGSGGKMTLPQHQVRLRGDPMHVVELQDDVAPQVGIEGEIGLGLAPAAQEADEIVLADPARGRGAIGGQLHRLEEDGVDDRGIAREPAAILLRGRLLPGLAAELQLDPQQLSQQRPPHRLRRAGQLVLDPRRAAGRPLGTEPVAHAIDLGRLRDRQVVEVEGGIVARGRGPRAASAHAPPRESISGPPAAGDDDGPTASIVPRGSYRAERRPHDGVSTVKIIRSCWMPAPTIRPPAARSWICLVNW